MNNFIAAYFPSLLLLSPEVLLRSLVIFLLLFFLGVFAVMMRRRGRKEASASLPKNKPSHIFLKIFVLGIFLCGVAGAKYFFELKTTDVSFSRLTDGDGYVALSDAFDAPIEEENGSVPTEASGTERNAAAIPKSENFRLGYIAVSGDNQIFLENAENKKLALLDIGYKTVVEEGRENTDAIVKWKTNKPSRGEVLYRKSSETDFRRISEESFNREHTLIAEKLGYGETYVFFISAKDKWGNVTESEKYAFYSGSDSPSLFDLLEKAFKEMFGWAM